MLLTTIIEECVVDTLHYYLRYISYQADESLQQERESERVLKDFLCRGCLHINCQQLSKVQPACKQICGRSLIDMGRSLKYKHMG